MILSPQQVNQLLKIIDKNQLIAIGTQLGPDFLSPADKDVLAESGVNWENFSAATDTVFTSFHYGMLAESLGQTFADNLTFAELTEYISKGRYIPLTFSEQVAIQTIKNQTFSELRTFQGRIFQDINQILTTNSLPEQQEFLRQEIAGGIKDRKLITEIAHDIARKTGDWGRDFQRIVAYNSHLAFEEGKAAMAIRDADGEDPTVYKTVFEQACKHCVELYLTAGIGSQPRLFKLSVLKGNGTNIGRKTAEWKATVGPIHPYCRCSMHTLLPGYIWDKDKKQFVAGGKKDEVPKRKKIRVWIAGKEEFV